VQIVGARLRAVLFACALAGAASAQTATVTSSGTIAVSSGATAATANYPSSIAISGLVGQVQTMSVSLNGINISAGSIADWAILLQSPTGLGFDLLDNACPGGPTGFKLATNATIVLSDTGSGGLMSGACTSTGSATGTLQHRPTTNYFSGFVSSVFPSPGPGTCSGPTACQRAEPDSTGNGSANTSTGAGTFAAVFGALTGAANGTGGPNGTWKLYVTNQAGTGGSIASWTLSITTAGAGLNTTTTLGGPNPSTIFTASPTNISTLTATVSSSSPVNGGTVTFHDNTTGSDVTCVSGAQTVSSGIATCGFASTVEETHSIVATYNGTSGFQASAASNAVSLVVTRHPTVSGSQFCNNGGTSIPGGVTAKTPATVYPSEIVIDSSNGLAGVIQKLTLQLNTINQTSNSIDSLAAILTGPNGKNYQFMTLTGGANTSGTSVSYTFDDTAASSPPESGSAGITGTYKPTSNTCTLTCDYASPAPVSFDMAAPAGGATLASEFAGGGTNGTWKLWLVNRGGTSEPSSIGGWCLNFTTQLGAHPTQTLITQTSPSLVTGSTTAPVTLTATVSVTDGSGLPVNAGTVQFTDGAVTLGTASVNSSGVATITSSAFQVFPQTSGTNTTEGLHHILASYSGTNTGTIFGVSSNTIDHRIDRTTVTPAALTPPAAAPTTLNYCNTGSIQNPGVTFPTLGAASPYPSLIGVTNMPGTLNNVSLTLKQWTSDYPQRTNSLVVGPNGGKLDFFSQVGGVVHVGPFDVTFADSAASSVGTSNSTSANLATGSFKPTSQTANNSYASCPPNATDCASSPAGLPAPSSFTYAAPAGAGTFANVFPGSGAFNGAGTWQLFMQSQQEGDNRGPLGGWCLNLTPNPPALTITESHSPTKFLRNSQGSFTVNVGNSGPGPTGYPLLTVRQILPTGLTYSSATGTDWSCSASGQTVLCTNPDPVAAGNAYPALTVTVDVGLTTATSISLAPEVWYGGSQGRQTATTDNITVIGTDLSIVKTHTGNFTVGPSGGTYTIKVHNAGPAATDTGETITVSESLPSGFSQHSLSGTGWSCSTLSCTSTTTIANGADSNPITLVVDVAANAPNATNSVSVSAFDDITSGNNTANDPTIVVSQVYNVTSTAADGAYKAGASIPITLAFNNPVAVTGTPHLSLDSGGTAAYLSGSGTGTLTFAYTVGAGENSSDLEAGSSIGLTGGTINDAVNTSVAASLALPAPGSTGSLGFNKNIVVDTTAPTVTNITSSTPNGAYQTGGTVSIQVSFSEIVNVTGTPKLLLNSGGTANYQSGSGGLTLTFGYTIGANDNTTDLDATSINLNGGAIADVATNAASLTLPTGASAGSLATNKDIVITSPTTTAAADTSASNSASDQTVSLSATVTSGGGTVNAGTVTFTFFDASNNQVGLATTSGTVTAGSASASYTLPGGTSAGSYSIHATFNGSANFLTSSDSAHHLTVNAPTTTTGANAAAVFSAGSQSVTLSATVTSAAGTVNGGTVTFTILDGSNQQVGQAATSGTVSNGAASASYSLPGSTATGTYTIKATYGGTASFLTSTDSAHTLIVNASTVTTASNASRSFSLNDQTVTLSATVTSAAGTVNGGTVTFTILNGANPVGSASTSTAVSGGAASASYTLPGGTAANTYTIQAVYSGSGNFLTSTDTAHTLALGGAATTTAAANAVAPFNASDQIVPLSASITSTAGTVNAGTVTFTVKSGSTVIGAPVTSGTVSSGAASANFTLPGGASIDTYTIQAVYSGGGNFAGSSDGAHTLTVNANTVQVTIGTSTSGQSFTIDGTAYTSQQTPTWTIGANHTLATTSPQTIGPAQYTFNHWSDGGAISHTVAASAGTTTYTATFDVKYATSTALQTSGSPTAFGDSVTFTATVTSSNGIPGGSVQFMDGVSTLGSPVSLNASGVATLSTSSLGAHTHSITAVYSGSSAHLGSTSGAVSQVVTGAASSTAVVSSLNPSTYPQSVTFTATVSGAFTAPTGTVTFQDGGVTLGVAALSGGIATYSTSSLAVGTRSITAVFGGDDSYAGSTSTTLSQVVNLASASVALLSSANPSTFGQSVQLTATVTGNNGGTPTGNVTFKDGIATLGVGTLSGGVATYTTSALAAGTHSMTAVYAGDAHFGSATSSALSQAVQKLTPTASVGSSVNPSVTGQLVTLTATVSGSADTPTGTVTFSSGGALGAATLNGGSGSITIALTGSASPLSITAQYSGDSEYASASAASFSQTVNAASTSVNLAASSNPALSGAPVTFTATVAVTSPGQGTPGGNITFFDGATSLGTVALSSGSASVTTSALSAGSHNITASYAGGAAFAASASSVLSEGISSTGTATVIVSSANPSVLGASVTFTATVTSSSASPQGSVTFFNGATQIGSPVTLAGGVASISTSALPSGTSSITATYSSSNGLSASTSGALSQVVLVPVTVQSSPSSAQFTVDGSAYTGSQTFNWAVGSSHSLGAPSPQAAGTGTQLVWSSWSNGAGTALQTVAGPSAATAYTVSFATQYLVTVSSNPALGGAVAGGGYYTAGALATLTATANSGYTFGSFSGAVSSTSNPASLTVTAPVSVTANFLGASPRLTVAVGQRTDGSAVGARNVVINLSNTGTGTAYNAQITSIDAIRVTSGSGPVYLNTGIPGPVPGATLLPNGSVAVPLTFTWDPNATRVQITFRMTATNADGSVSYPVTQTVTTIR
jgi:large repetitive protein